MERIPNPNKKKKRTISQLLKSLLAGNKKPSPSNSSTPKSNKNHSTYLGSNKEFKKRLDEAGKY